MREIDHCCVVDSPACKAPATQTYYVKLGTCFRCGQPVCTNCSLRVVYLRYGRRRLCHTDLDELDREANVPRDRRRAYRHLCRLADYPR